MNKGFRKIRQKYSYGVGYEVLSKYICVLGNFSL